jgi:hypothetical protein
VAAARGARSTPVFPVSNLPAQRQSAQPNRKSPRSYHAPEHPPPHDTPKCYFFRAGGFPLLPPCVSACQDLQRQLTSHVKAGGRLVCGVFAGHIGTFQYHSAQQCVPPLLAPVGFYLCFRCAPRVAFNALGVALSGLGYPHTRSAGGLFPCT